MADVFISYSHEDVDFVRRMVPQLEAEGLTVWWDHTIPPGQSWDTFIAKGIREAKAAVVVWSKTSVESDWVKEEATVARGGGKYMPIQIDGSTPPMGFSRVQAANLMNWNGDKNDPQWRLLSTEIVRLARSDGQPGASTPRPDYAAPPPPPARPAPEPVVTQGGGDKKKVWTAVAIGAVVLLGALWLAAPHNPPSAPVSMNTTTDMNAPDPSKPYDSATNQATANPDQQAEIDRLRQEKEDALAAAQRAQQEAEDAARRAQQQQQQAAVNAVGVWNGDVKFSPRSGTSTTPDQNVTFTLKSDGTWSNPFNYIGTWTLNGSNIKIVYTTDPNHAVYMARINGDTMTGTMVNDYWAGSYVLHKLQ